MKTLSRACTGTAMAILCACLASPTVIWFADKPWRGPLTSALFLLILVPALTMLAGPGVFLLAWIHAVQMECWSPRARTLAQLRKVGVLTGLPLGVGAMVLTSALLCLLSGRPLSFSSEMAAWLIPALAGGAGLGWGVTIGLVSETLQAEPRTPRRPLIRRDGPPFFDNRPARTVRRAA